MTENHLIKQFLFVQLFENCVFFFVFPLRSFFLNVVFLFGEANLGLGVEYVAPYLGRMNDNRKAGAMKISVICSGLVG